MQEIDILIVGGKVLAGHDNTCCENYSVAIGGNQIIAIGPSEVLTGQYHAKKTIMARESLIMPGLINCHTHAAMTCFRGIADDMELMDWLHNYIFPAEAKNLSENLVYWGSLLAAVEMIKSGTTTFCDMYIFEEEVARAACDAGMRCLIGEGLFDFPSPNAKNPQEGLAYNQRFIEKWRNNALVNVIIVPHSLYTCSQPVLMEAKILADKYNLPIGIHLLENKSEKEQLEQKFGKSAVSFLKDIGYLNERFMAYHCVCLTEEDIDLFAGHGCSVVHNPVSNMKLASGVAPIPDMLKSGITVGLGTDGCASNNNLDMFKEMSTAAKLHKVFRLDPTALDARSVVNMATIEGAKTLGMEKITGSLEVGKKADIIIIGLNEPHLTPLYNEYSHLVYAANGADVDTVLINGRIVMEERRLLTVDEKEVMEKVREVAVKIKKSLQS
jgi:5-methylthioadenosine/S-adenosylhomocysteine deaminase